MAEKAESNFEVSATGGAGTNGQAAMQATGIDRAYDFMDIQTSAKMNKSGVQLPKGVGKNAPVMSGDEVTPLGAPTAEPNVPVSNGAVYGDGQGPEALASTAMLDMQNSEDIMKLKAILPILKKRAESPSSTHALNNFVRWVDSQ
jgi:hypothetical protein